MKTEELKEKGLTEDQIAFVMAENGKDLKKVQKENENLASDRDKWKTQAETAEETLKKFDGVDLETMKTELSAWKQKAETAEKEFNRKMEERNFNDILTEAIKEEKGKNEKAIRALLDTENLMKSKNQKADIMKALNNLKISEDSSFLFIDEKQQKAQQQAARFTTAGTGKTPGGHGTMTKKDIYAIKDPSERQAAIAENLGLFGQGEE